MCANVDYEHPDLLVDYGRSATAQSVLERFTRWILQHDESPIEVLYECGSNQLLRPSWCPNWHLQRESTSLRKWKMGKEVYTAGGTGKPLIRFDTRTNATLCKGFVVDRVAQLSPILFLAPNLKPEQELTSMLAWESRARYWLVKNVWPNANREISSHFGNMVQIYRDQRSLEESYVRTLVGNNLKLSNTATDQKAAYETLLVAKQGLDLDLGVSITTLFPDEASYARYERMSFGFLRQMDHLARGRRFCTTHGGFIGLVPARVRSGDAIVILLGAVAPFTNKSRT